MTRDYVVEVRYSAGALGRRVGFTSGCFDILHAGHVDYLEKAKAICDCLIVAVNTDASIRKNKGEGRPINPENERLKVVSALKSVDHAFLFDETNNNVNIEMLKPDVYIKAGDYDLTKLSSKSIVEKYGGTVELIPLEYDVSTSDVIERILCKQKAI